MVTVRGKQRNWRRGRISKTSVGKHRKKQHQLKKKVIISNELIRSNWDDKKTLNENFSNLGLIADPNAKYRTTNHKKENGEVEFEDISKYDGSLSETEVVKKLTETSKNDIPSIRHFSPAEVKLWEHFITKYDCNYKAMSRDKQNTHQHTPKQMKRKIESYLQFKTAEHKTNMGH